LKLDKSEVQSSKRFERNLSSKSHALGIRHPGFVPAQADFDAYLEERDRILQSPSGRALRLRGGIVGRIAADVVPEVRVLDGPSDADEIVGSFGDTVFVDDGIDLETLDVVCGVYYVKVLISSDKAFTHSSFWPKQWVWESTGLSGDQWLPEAEAFYQVRLANFKAKTFEIKGSTYWKGKTMFHHTHTRRILRGSERLSAEYISLSR